MNFPTIYTPRCLIRPLALEDATSMHAALKASFKELKKWMPWAANGLASLEDTEYFINQCMKAWERPLYDRNERTLVIMDVQNKYFMGSIGLTPLNLLIPSFEIGYWIDQRLVGQGLMTEAINGLVHYLWAAYYARRIEIHCEVNNEKSANVAKRLNFPLEARMMNARLAADGKSVVDILLYAMSSDINLPKIEVTWD